MYLSMEEGTRCYAQAPYLQVMTIADLKKNKTFFQDSRSMAGARNTSTKVKILFATNSV